MKLFLSTLIALSSLSFNPALAQSRWRAYSPPDRSFTVELPGAPKFKRGRLSRQDDLMFRRGGFGYTAYTIRSRRGSPETIFNIGVLLLTTPIDDREFDENTYTFIGIYGGDKEDSNFKKNAAVRVHGFHGREYIYEVGESVGRALFINAGKRAYFLIYHTESARELSSEAVTRMFSTFRPVS